MELAPMLLQLLILAAGIAILAKGADLFVRGASGIAERFGISQFAIGLVIVGFGTSTPELAVNLDAALTGSTDIAIGNVVGSNIANVGVILGLAAVVAPLAVHLRMVKVELPIMIGVSFLLWGLASFGEIKRWEGVLMLLAFAAFLWFLLKTSKNEPADVQQEYAAENRRAPRQRRHRDRQRAGQQHLQRPVHPRRDRADHAAADRGPHAHVARHPGDDRFRPGAGADDADGPQDHARQRCAAAGGVRGLRGVPAAHRGGVGLRRGRAGVHCRDCRPRGRSANANGVAP